MTVTAVADVPSTWPEVEAYMRSYYQSAPGDWRLGQAYFNALLMIYPEIAELVRGTDADPFYADSVKDPRFQKFYDVVVPYFQ